MSDYLKKETHFIEDEDGNRIPYMKKDPKFFFRKITLLYGETESGKSTIIQENLFLLKGMIPNIIIFSPTNDSNNLYTGKVGKPGIINKISMEILEEINERQKKAMYAYSIANNIEIMKSLFLKVADDRLKSIINSVNRDAVRHLQIAYQRYTDPSIRRSEEDKIRNLRDTNIRNTYKQCIKANEKILLKDETLTDAQRVAAEYHDHNPDILLVFDDCASFFKEHQKEPLIMDMFYQGRHDAITSIFSFQGDKDIPPNLRRAAHTAIFTTSACAMAHFSTSSNGYDKNTKKRIEKAISRIFRQDGDSPSYSKLAFLRNEQEKIQVILADRYDDFLMGGLWVRKFIQAIEPKSLASGSNKALIKELLASTRS